MEHIHHSQQLAQPISWWQSILQYFSEADFMPHGHCYLWKPGLVYTHVISDFLIGTAYVAISFTLYGLVKKTNLGFNRVVLCFGVFIGACGWTHYNEIWNLWQSDYWYSGMVKVLTAIASVATGIYLFKLRHPIVAMASAAKLSEQRRLDLESLTRDLESKIEERSAAHRESEARFRQLADSMTQLAWVTEPDGYIFWYNKRWFEYTGTDLEEMLGDGWQKVHHPDHVSRVLNFLKEAWKKPEPWELTFPLRSASGEYRWFLTRAVPLTNSQGEIVQWFGTNTDIDEQIKIRQKLEKSQYDLQQALKARDEFLSIASHELKTPLTSLKIQFQLLDREGRKGNQEIYSKGKVDHSTEKALRLVSRLDRLIEDMLDVARIRTGKLTVHKERINVTSLVKDVIERMQDTFLSHTGDKIDFQVEDDCFAAVDPMRMEQVLTNLLQNSLKYGSGKKVQVALKSDGHSLTISINDQGIGIPPELQDKIFHAFERGVNANEVSGLGLGLFISQQIVKDHNGKIWVDSEMGKGSTFHVQFPK